MYFPLPCLESVLDRVSFSLFGFLSHSLTPLPFHSFSPDLFTSPDVGLRVQIGHHVNSPNNRSKQTCEEGNDEVHGGLEDSRGERACG